MADSYVHIGLTEILIPLTGEYRPGAVAWGVVGVYLLAAVEITSLLRRRISRRAWRWTHSLSFVLFGFATIHGLTAGTDAGSSVLRIAMLAVTLGVVGLTIASIEHHLHKRAPGSSAGDGEADTGSAQRRPLHDHISTVLTHDSSDDRQSEP